MDEKSAEKEKSVIDNSSLISVGVLVAVGFPLIGGVIFVMVKLARFEATQDLMADRLSRMESNIQTMMLDDRAQAAELAATKKQ